MPTRIHNNIMHLSQDCGRLSPLVRNSRDPIKNVYDSLVVKRIGQELNCEGHADCNGHPDISRFPTSHRIHLLVCGMAIAIAFSTPIITGPTAGAASASAPQLPTPMVGQRRVARHIAALAADQWWIRQRAERSLLSTKDFILPQLAAAMVKAKNPEKRNRLLRICMQLYLRQFNWLHHGRSFMGMEFIARPLELRKHGVPQWIPAVAVVRTIAGFPGGLFLHQNDLILGLNGRKIPAYNTATAFRAKIQQYPPGDTITLLLLRYGKLIKVTMQLVGIPTAPLAMQEYLQQRNIIAQHLMDQYLPVKPLLIESRHRHTSPVWPVKSIR